MKKTSASEINIPNWLVKLPSGWYCISQLTEITGLTYHCIYQRLHALGIPHHKKKVPLGLGVTKPLIFYVWEGFEKESERINKLRLARLSKDKKGVNR